MKDSQQKHSVALGLPRGRGMAAAATLAAAVCAAYVVLLLASGGIAGSGGVLDLARAARSAGQVLFRPPSAAQTVHVAPGSSGVARPAQRAALSIDLGRLPSATSISDAVHVTNSADVSRDMHVRVLGAPGVSAVFAASGGADLHVAPRATAAIALQATGTHAGPIDGQVRVTVAGSPGKPITLPLSGAQAPLPVPRVEAKPLAGGRVAVSWTASPSTGVAGYQVFRTNHRGRRVPVARTAATTLVDTTAPEGSAVYEVRPIAAAVRPALLGGPVEAAPAVADATPPAAPASWSAPDVVNAADETSVAVSVALPASSTPDDRVAVGVSDGERQVRADETAGGTTVSASFDVSSLADGPLRPFVVVTDAVGNSATYAAPDAILKDTVAPAAPDGVTMRDGDAPDGTINAANAAGVQVNVAAAAGDTVVAELANGGAAVRADGPLGSPLQLDATQVPDGTLTLAAWVVDRAGNASGRTVVYVSKDTQAPRAPLEITTAPDERSLAGYVSASSQHDAAALLRFDSATSAGNRIVAKIAGVQVAAQGGSDQIPLGPVDLSGQPDGAIPVSGTITDAAGNVTDFDGRLVKDTVAPPAPLRAFAQAGDGIPGRVTADQQACVDVHVALGDGNDPTDRVAISVTQDGVEVDGQSPAGDGDVTIPCLDLSGLHRGFAKLEGTVRDAAGNVTAFAGRCLHILPAAARPPAAGGDEERATTS